MPATLQRANHSVNSPLIILKAAAFANAFSGAPPKLDCTGPILSEQECKTWFAQCVLIAPENRIIGPRGIKYAPEAFNSSFGGKLFVVDPNGKTTSRAWDAATQSLLWTIPKVDGTRFLPGRPLGEITTDGLGRTYLNTYLPAKIETLPGDIGPFYRHLQLLLPVQHDQTVLLEYLAHSVKYPGFKIPWAPLIQSVEGVGKNVFKQIVRYAISPNYFYQPKAKQLHEGGSKFNSWMEGKLFYLVDEIKTDENRDMVEILKPFITEDELEIEGKGTNQQMGDTPGNWLFFSNHKNAIPIHRNGRRFAIFYSAIQTLDDLNARRMDKQYFDGLYNWLGDKQNGGHQWGLKIVADYLLNYPIERGAISTRAPSTSSQSEALVESRGWLEQLIMDAVESERPGFRGGWVSTAALGRLIAAERKSVASRTVGKALQELGYTRIGQAGRGYFQDDPINPTKRPYLWNVSATVNAANYGLEQGYET